MKIKGYAIILFLAIVFTYSNTLFNQFTNEDEYLITNNSFVQDIENAKELFNPKHFLNPIPILNGARPLTVFSLMLDHHIYSGKPLGFHLTNILIHSLNVLLVFALFLLFKTPPGHSFFMALLYGIHPLVGEVVNVPGFRADLLMGFFALSSLLVFLKYASVRNIRAIIVGLILFLFAVFSKETSIMLSLILFSYMLIYQRKNSKLKVLTGLLVIISGFFVFSYWLGRYAYKAHGLFYVSILDGISPMDSIFNYLGAVFVPIFMYFRNIFFPFMVNFEYQLNIGTLSIAYIFGIILTILFFCSLIFAKDKKIKFFLLFTLFFYLPASNIIPLHNTLSDRYFYLPLIGMIYVIYRFTWGVLDKFSAGERKILGIKLKLFPLYIVLTFLMIISFNRNFTFYDTSSLYKRAFLRAPENPRSAFNYAMAAHKEGSYLESTIVLEHFTRTWPRMDAAGVWHILGRNYFYLGDFEKGIMYFKRAIRIEPRDEVIEEFGQLLSEIDYQG